METVAERTEPEIATELAEVPAELELDYAPADAGGGVPSVVTPPTTELDDRAARVELRRQIARMESELGSLFASAFPRSGIDWGVPAPGGGPRVLDVDDLERVRDSLALRLQEARADLHSQVYVEERNRRLLEEVVARPEDHHWVRVSNEDIGEPGCRHWHSRPRWGLLGMLMGWWRVKLSSGCP